MYVSEEWRGTVCFLVQDDPARGTAFRGTGFFVAVPTSEPALKVHYLVTAAHVARARAPGRALRIMANTLSGLSQDITVPDDSWFEHPGPGTTDVAVARISDDVASSIVGTGIGVSLLVDDAFLKSHKVGCGQEVFAMGLFLLHTGKASILPVARFGHVSLLPDPKEKVHVHLGGDEEGDIEAYLVETHSWGGESGSPVFLYHRGGGITADRHGEVLGLMHGHWDIDRAVERKSDKSKRPDETVGVNSGIAIVVPASKIVETLTQDELLRERERLAEEFAKHRPMPTPDLGT